LFGIESGGSALDTIAHVIQTALTPVFLLSGIATLLNVFSTRLARVADRVRAVGKALEDADRAERRALSVQLARLHRRSITLEITVLLAGVSGAATCAAVLTLFVGSLRDETIGSVLVGLFGVAVVCALAAIAAFSFEMLLAGIAIRDEVAQKRRLAAEDEAAEPHQTGGEAGGVDTGAGS
jgi:Protein of unknown function (DUF2721)